MRQTAFALTLLALVACHKKSSDDGIVVTPPGGGDPPFTLLQQADASINAVALAADGSGDVYVGGFFTIFNRSKAPRIVRLNPDGTVDSAFSSIAGFDDFVEAIVPATDGSGDIYVGGSFLNYNSTPAGYILRLNSDGTTDPTFNTNGGFNGAVHALALAGDGSGDLYVGGQFSSYGGAGAPGIVRLNSNGTIDAGFVTGTGFAASPFTLAAEAGGTGDIYVAGSFTSYNGTASNRIIRLNANGSVDAGFVVGTGFDAFAMTLAVATDGSGDVYAGGFFTTYNAGAAPGVIRLNSNGTADAGFAVGTGFNGQVYSSAVAADGSGDVYVGGTFTTYKGVAQVRIARVNSDGTIDAGFSTGTGCDSVVQQIRPVAGSGDVYLAGDFTDYNGAGCGRMVRAKSDGTLDAGFPAGGGFDDQVNGLAPATDGSGDVYVVGAFSSYNGAALDHITRLNPDGSIDSAFVPGLGFNNDPICVAVALDGSGDIYVGGIFTNYGGTAVNRIVRINSDGSIDAGFVVGTGFSGQVTAIAPAADGSGDIYVGGQFTTYKGAAANRIIRINSNGSADAGFAIGTAFDGNVRALAVAVDGTGDVYAGGDFTAYGGTASNRIVRINSNGTIDAGFAIGTGANNNVKALALATDGTGDVYVGGDFTTFNALAYPRFVRLNANGSVDTGFDPGSGPDSSVDALAMTTDGTGDVIAGGTFVLIDVMPVRYLARLAPSGAISLTFNTPPGFENFTTVIAPGSGGDLYVGGLFTSAGTATAGRIVLLNADGSVD